MPSTWWGYCSIYEFPSSILNRKKTLRSISVGNDRSEYDGNNGAKIASGGNTHHYTLLLWWIPAACQWKRNSKGRTSNTKHCPNNKQQHKVGFDKPSHQKRNKQEHQHKDTNKFSPKAITQYANGEAGERTTQNGNSNH